jgi:type II secretion system protein L
MTACRIRVARETPASGAFEWVTLGKNGETLSAGSGNLAQPPVKGPCEVVLASDLVTLDLVAAPALQRKRLGSALRFLAEELALPDPEQLHVAATPGPARDTLCLAIVDRQWLQSLLAKLADAGLSAESAYPESLLPALAPRTWTVVLRGGEGFLRMGANEAIALDVAGANTVPAALQAALEQARAAGAVPQAIVVRPGDASELPDLGAWSTALGVPLEAGPPWHWAGAQARPEIEILQGDFAVRRRAAPWLQRLKPAATMAAALLLLSSVAIAIDWGAKARERRLLVEEMRTLFRDTFGASAVLVDPPLQMARSLAELRQQAGYAGRGDFLVMLRVFAEDIRDPARHRIESVSFENAALSVTLRHTLGLQPAALAKELRAKAVPQGYELRVDEAPASGTVNVRLLLKAGT